MDIYELNSEASNSEEKESKLPLKISTRSSFGSFHHLSPIGSPQSSFSKISCNFSEYSQNVEKQEKTGRLSVNKVKSFHRAYLDKGMWPDIAPNEQAKFKTDYRELKTKLSEKKQKVKDLKKVIVSERENCSNCAEWKKKNELTQVALKQAVELSTMLLSEIKRK